MCQTIVLSRRGAAVISQCMECKLFTIWHQNLMLLFTPKQFRQFKEFTEEMDVEDCLFPFPGGEDRLVLRTPHSDINFSFSREEWEDFHVAMEEAIYMQGIYQMMY